MRIGLWHGYLLAGTGSNIFTTNLLREYSKAGINTVLFSQEQNPEDYDFIEHCYVAKNQEQCYVEAFTQTTLYPGKCVMFRPFIGSTLPVYVEDVYPGGLVARSYPNLSQEQINTYIEYNTKAIDNALAIYPITKLLVNHALTGPLIARDALAGKTPYSVVLHGSDLTYAASKNAQLRQLTIDGCAHAQHIFAAGESLSNQFSQICHGQLDHLVQIVTPGVDTSLFQPVADNHPHTAEIAWINEWARDYAHGATSDAKALAEATAGKHPTEAPQTWAKLFQEINNRATDADFADNFQRIFTKKTSPALFVGKLIAEKGPHLFMLALPMVAKQVTDLSGMLVGFGEDRPLLQALQTVLRTANRPAFEKIIIALEERLDDKIANQFWNSLDPIQQENYLKDAASYYTNQPVAFCGLLPHGPLSKIIPFASSVTIPSLIRESFGMIAIEVLACGTRPIVTNTAGLGEIAEEASKEKIPCGRLTISGSMIEQIAHEIVQASADELTQEFPKEKAWQYADAKYSWKAVSLQYIS